MPRKPQEINIQSVPADEISRVWSVVEGLLELALEKEGYGTKVSSILPQLETQCMQLWLALVDRTIVAALTTELMRYPEVLVARVVLAGGTQESSWEGQFAEKFEAWAREQGADIVEVQGRPGWARRLKKYEMNLHSVTMQKVLKTAH